MDKFDHRLYSAAVAVEMESFRTQFHMIKLQHNINELMFEESVCCGKKIKNDDETH